jgi:hypothetical protein
MHQRIRSATARYLRSGLFGLCLLLAPTLPLHAQTEAEILQRTHDAMHTGMPAYRTFHARTTTTMHLNMGFLDMKGSEEQEVICNGKTQFWRHSIEKSNMPGGNQEVTSVVDGREGWEKRVTTDTTEVVALDADEMAQLTESPLGRLMGDSKFGGFYNSASEALHPDSLELAGKAAFGGQECFRFLVTASSTANNESSIYLYINTRTYLLAGLTVEPDKPVQKGESDLTLELLLNYFTEDGLQGMPRNFSINGKSSDGTLEIAVTQTIEALQLNVPILQGQFNKPR